MTTSVSELAQKIINGYRIKRGDDLEFFKTCDLEELERGAGAIQKRYRRNHVDLCSIINGRSGRCPEDCKYCAQSAHHCTGIDEYPFLPKEKIYAEAKKNQDAGLNRFAIVTAGRALTGEEFEKALDAFRMMKKDLTIELCASMGFLNAEQFHRLHEVGVTSYHHNIETSKRFFPQICTTHTYDDKIRTIKIAQKEGLCVCSGGIIGMGEDWDDRLDMAISLAELNIYSIPINALMPIKGTALEDRPQIPAEDVMRTIAFFRYINPEANIRLAAGRKVMPDNGEKAFMSGASASISGDMLTTCGTTIKGDLAILKKLGLSNEGANDWDDDDVQAAAN
ncbi:MAG: biotin synthase BioB [Schwartzia succinivorans]|nr:biotin synthase BioB [Schwartzia succinivorans]